MMTPKDVIEKIDHTVLGPLATSDLLEKACSEAVEFGFGRVFVNPSSVPAAVNLLKKTDVAVGTVVGFPYGFNSPGVKTFECEELLLAGAKEIDMVLNIPALKEEKLQTIRREIRGVVLTAKRHKVGVKVIIETCYLTDDEKISACKAALESGAAFVKTSTGFGPAGATAKDVRLMRNAVEGKIGVKASGGIKTLDTAIEMINAGAARIGTSSGATIAREALAKLT